MALPSSSALQRRTGIAGHRIGSLRAHTAAAAACGAAASMLQRPARHARALPIGGPMPLPSYHLGSSRISSSNNPARQPHSSAPGARRRRPSATAAAAPDAGAPGQQHVAPPNLPGMQPGGSYDAAANADYWATRPVPVVARCLAIAAELARCVWSRGLWLLWVGARGTRGCRTLRGSREDARLRVASQHPTETTEPSNQNNRAGGRSRPS
jgi:hypothetical protein